MQDGKLINIAMDKYANCWKKQDDVFCRIGESNPYPSPQEINIDFLTADEKEKIIATNKVPEIQAFRDIYDLIKEKFKCSHSNKVLYEKAIQKLNFQLYDQIPIEKTCSLDDLYYSIPAKLGIERKELLYLYKEGYLPHLYWNDGKPRFDNRMWFILDFNIREAKKEMGIGFINNLSQWKPKWYHTKQYLELTLYMYNSWNIGETILSYSDKKSRKSGLKDGDFRIFSRGLTHSLWCNEGRVIAEEIIKRCPLSKYPPNLIEYYRDIIALLSFDAYPVSYLIDLYHKPEQRQGVMFSYEEFARISVHNLGIGDVNTYSSENLAMKYEHLFSAIDWALSMNDGVTNRKVVDIVSRYRDRQRRHESEIPCRICGTLFKPKRPKYQVTCGKKECIQKNKQLSKRSDAWSTPPIYLS